MIFMSTAVSELKEKLGLLDHEEVAELIDFLEDLEDRLLAEDAKRKNDFVSWEEYQVGIS